MIVLFTKKFVKIVVFILYIAKCIYLLCKSFLFYYHLYYNLHKCCILTDIFSLLISFYLNICCNYINNIIDFFLVIILFSKKYSYILNWHKWQRFNNYYCLVIFVCIYNWVKINKKTIFYINSLFKCVR